MFESFLRLGDVVPYASNGKIYTGEIMSISRTDGVIMLNLGGSKNVALSDVGKTAYKSALTYNNLQLQQEKRRLEEAEEAIRNREVEISKLQEEEHSAKEYRV